VTFNTTRYNSKTAAIAMTLSVLEGHFPTASLFKYIFSYFMVRRAISLNLQSFYRPSCWLPSC